MSRRTRRAAIHHRLNRAPDIHLFEPSKDPLAVLLDGGMTHELAVQLDKAKPKEERRPANDEQIGITWIPPSPLLLTLFHCFCTNCGKDHDTFGFLSRKVIENGPYGSVVTSYKVVAQTDYNEKPKEVEVKQQTVPYCHFCMAGRSA